jgi:hypothetical protein
MSEMIEDTLQLTPEGEWFLKIFDYISSELEDRAEMVVYTDGDSVSVGTLRPCHKIYFDLILTEKDGVKELSFHFKKYKIILNEKKGEMVIVGKWMMPVVDGREILKEVYRALLELPLEFSEEIKIVKRIDNMIREEEEKVLKKEEVKEYE